MSILDLTQHNMEDVVEPEAVQEGEYKLRLIECEGVKENASGNPYILPRFEIPEEPTSKDLTHYMALPHDGMDAKDLNKTLARLKTFGEAFGVDFGRQVEFEELAGLEGWAILGHKDDEEYGPQNFVKKFITGA